jgi:hypothetical protein
MKRYAILFSVISLPALALADNVGECGWGSKVWEGNRGIGPQVMAITTNGLTGSQTFGITTGTSGCTQSGVVRSNWKLSLFVQENKIKIANEIATGEGETISNLASLLAVEEAKTAVFKASLKSNYSTIFPEGIDTSTLKVVDQLLKLSSI